MRYRSPEEVRIRRAVEFAERVVDAAPRTPLSQQDRWVLIAENERAYASFRHGVRNEAALWWGAMLNAMVVAYLLDNGRFRRDDFDAARALLSDTCGN